MGNLSSTCLRHSSQILAEHQSGCDSGGSLQMELAFKSVDFKVDDPPRVGGSRPIS